MSMRARRKKPQYGSIPMRDQCIFIDATSTFLYGGNSGIQRVTRNIVNHSPAVAAHIPCLIQPIVWTGFGFIGLPGSLSDQSSAVLRFLPWQARRRRSHERVGSPSAASLATRVTQRIGQIACSLHIQQWYERIVLFIVCFLSVPRLIAAGRFISFRESDVVLLIDSTWNSMSMLDALASAQKRFSVRVAPMIHDLFPLTLPQTCEEATVRCYSRWFYRVIPKADFVVTNSKATQRSLEAFIAASPGLRIRPLAIITFRLGAELDLIRSPQRRSKSPVELINLPGVVLLSIGTIEPRKNISYILDAFDHLRRRGVDVSLVIIGRRGWKCDEVINRISNHPDLGVRLLHYSNASDSLLSSAIDRADCLVNASIAEGFGLPVVEGLRQGLDVFASDIDVFREIANDYCCFFPLSDPQLLADAIQRWAFARSTVATSVGRQPFDWVGWEDSTRELMESVRALLKSGELTQSNGG